MPKAKRAIVVVTNDLSTDRRVARTCQVLQECGYQLELLGRKLPRQQALQRTYATHRMGLLFNKGALFYAEYNLRAFFYLLFRRADLIVSNDLDTLLACKTASRVKGSELLYDSHEFFTEVPELEGRFARRVWLAIEKAIFPRLKHVLTVNDSIADEYQKRYGIRPVVVRNMGAKPEFGEPKSRAALKLPEDKTILIMQGAGINVDRGAEEAVYAMKQLPNCFLLLVGGGDAWPVLKKIVQQEGLETQVRMIDRLPYEQMMQYTRNADLGLSLDKDSNLNYRYSLPNKVFDYLYAGIPVLSSALPELTRVLETAGAGLLLPTVSTENIVAALRNFQEDKQKSEKLRQNAKFAASNLDPEKEKDTLRNLIERIVY